VPNGTFYKPFREFAYIQGNLGKMDKNWTVIQTSHYAKHLKPWLKFFPMNKIFVYSAEELVTNPAKVLKELQIFLQLRFYVGEPHFKINGTGGFPCLVDPNDSDQACVNESMKAVHLPHNSFEFGLTNNLKAFFLKKNQDFFNLTGKYYQWT
jgi:hypothetical protein